MGPIKTGAMIDTIVGYLAKRIKENSSVQDFFSDFPTESVSWIKPLFFKNGNENEKIINDLFKNPDSAIKQDQVKTAIASHLEDNPDDEIFLMEMYKLLERREGTWGNINIMNSKNVVHGNISSGGNVIIGDKYNFE